MKKITLLIFLLTLTVFNWNAQAQCPDGETTVLLTISGGNYPGEKWMSITDQPNGEGEVIWDQSYGTDDEGEYGANAGTTDSVNDGEPFEICIPEGTTLYINAFDKYGDSWDGTLYELTDPSGTILIANNGGESPDNGEDEDTTSTFTDAETELEVSEEFSFTPPTCPAPSGISFSNITATSLEVSWETGGASAWEVLILEASEAAPGDDATGTEALDNSNFALNSLTENTSYVVYIRDVCAEDDKSPWTPKAVSTPYACPFPTEIDVDNITGNSADITWVTGGATSWEVIVQVAGSDVPTEESTGTVVENTASYNPMDLAGVTSYEVYIRDICSDDEKSIWAGPIAFETTCATIVPYYNQNFASYLPSCWEEKSGGSVADGPGANTSSNWGQSNFINGTNTNGSAARTNMYSSNNQNWLLTPSFDVTADDYEVNFDLAITPYAGTSQGTFGVGHTLYLLITTDNGASWEIIESWNNESTIDNENPNLTFPLTSYTGVVQFAFFADVASTASGDNDVFVDNFAVRTPPTCPVPTDLASGAITSTTAEISWTTGGASSWDVIFVTAGSPFPAEDATTNVTETTDNPHTVTGLAPATDYEIYIRDICAADDKSYWVGPIAITTECAVFDITYTQDFENYLPNCWETGSEGSLTEGPANDSSFSWAQDDFGNDTANVNGKAARENIYGTSGYQWLIAPFVEIPDDGSTYEVNYDFALTNYAGTNESELGANQFVYVLYKLEGTTEWVLLNTFDSSTPISNTGSNFSSYLYEITGPVQVAFVTQANGGSGDSDFFVDNFKFQLAPDCLTPANLTASNITATSADLEWEGYDGLNWDIVIQEEGTGTPDDTTVPTVEAHATETYNATGLNSNTTYEFYIQSNCADDEESVWVGPFVFATPCDNITPDYSQDFATYLPDCWTEGNGGNSIDGPDNTNLNDDWQEGDFANDGTNENGQAATIQMSGNGGKGWLISPYFDIPAGDLHEVRFDVALTDFGTNQTTLTDGYSITLLYTTDLGTTWNTLITYDHNSSISNVGQEDFAYLEDINGVVQFAFFANEEVWGSTSNFFVDNFKVQLAPSCLQPTELTANNITGTTATIEWEGGNGTTWNVVVQTAGTGEPTDSTELTAEGLTETTHDITDLDALTDYEYWVQSTCSDTDASYWSGPYYFTTPCANYIPEYTEQFEEYLPECWEEATGGTLTEGPEAFGSSSWGQNNFANDGAHQNAQSARINVYGTTAYQWLISPNVDIPDTETHEVNFDMALTAYFNQNETTLGDGQTVDVLYTTDGGTTWISLESFDNSSTISNTGENKFYALEGISGVVKFAFVTKSNGTGDNDFFIDNFKVRIAPTCLQPTNLDVQNITATSADISWTEGNATTWDIIIQTANYDDPAGDATPTVSQHNETNYTVNTLAPATLYEVYVRDYCSDDDQSFWTGPFTFMTPCGDFYDIPYLEGFNSYTASETCWTVLNANGDSDEWDMNFEEAFSEGDQAASIKTDLNNGNNDDFLISPAVNLTGDDILRFKHKSGSEIQGDNFQILVSETNNFDLYTPGADGNDVANNISVLLPLNSDDEGYTNINFEQIEIDLSSMTGIRYFAWHVPSIDGLDGTSLTIDDVKFIKTPNCPAVINITTTDISDVTVTLNWEDPANVGNYDVAYVPFGAGLPTTWTETTDLFYVFTDLDPNTKYDFYVRSVCEDNINESEWSDPATVQTACGIISDLPWIEDFEDMEEVGVNIIPECMEAEGQYYMSLDQEATFNRHAYSGANYLAFDYDSNAWLKTPYFDLDKDKNYKLKFKYSTSGFAGFQFSAWFGTTRDIESYEGHPIGFTQGDDEDEVLDNTEYVEYSAVFSPLVSGQNSIGIHLESDIIAFYLTIDDIELIETDEPVTNPDVIGVGENVLEGLSLYPNPTNDILNVEYKQAIDHISVVNLLGQEVISVTPNTNKQTIDMSQLSTGTYVVKVISGGSFGTYKIMKN